MKKIIPKKTFFLKLGSNTTTLIAFSVWIISLSIWIYSMYIQFSDTVQFPNKPDELAAVLIQMILLRIFLMCTGTVSFLVLAAAGVRNLKLTEKGRLNIQAISLITGTICLIGIFLNSTSEQRVMDRFIKEGGPLLYPVNPSLVFLCGMLTILTFFMNGVLVIQNGKLGLGFILNTLVSALPIFIAFIVLFLASIGFGPPS